MRSSGLSASPLTCFDGLCATMVLDVDCCSCESGYGFETAERLRARRCSDAAVVNSLGKYLREEKQHENN